jgi:hypothetical protein
MARKFEPSAERGPVESAFSFTDRRAAPRFRAVCFDVTVERAGSVGLFRARNVSDTGMMLHTHDPLEVGEAVRIGLAGRLAVGGTVLWTNEHCCGIEFDRPFDCAALLKAGLEH